MNEKLGLFGQYLTLAKADGEISVDELQSIKAFAKHMGLSDAQLDAALKGSHEVEVPTDSMSRFTQFYKLILLANADEKVTASEKMVLRGAGLTLGLDSQLVEALIEEMQNHERGIIPHERLVVLFGKFQN